MHYRLPASVVSHHCDELVIVDFIVTIEISITDHFIHFFISQSLPEITQNMSELRSAYVPVAVPIVDFEGLLELFLCVRALHFSGHHVQELGEINSPIAIRVDLIDHVLELRLSGALS